MPLRSRIAFTESRLRKHLLFRLHRSRGAKKSGPKYAPGRTQKVEEAKKVRALCTEARKKRLKGEALHEYICTNMKREILSDSSWWKRLLRNPKSKIENDKGGSDF